MNPGLLSIAMRVLDCPVPGKVEEALRTTALNFLAAGGHVTLTEWAAMPDEERLALHYGAQLVALENARLLAREIISAQADAAGVLG